MILREMETKPGQVFNAKRLGRDLNRIYNLNYFEDISYERRPGPGRGKQIVVIQVREKLRGGPAIGIGFSSRSELVGFADCLETNYHGTGRTISFRNEFGDRKSWAASYFEPWADSKHTSVGVELFDRLIYREPTGKWPGGALSGAAVFDEQRDGFRLAVGRPLSDTVAVSARLKREG